MGLALIEKIIALFLMLFAGFALVKKDILKKEDSQTLSKLCLYLISPCVLFHAFTVEVTPERQRAFFLCGVLALGIQGFFTLFIFFLDKIFPMTVVEKTAVIYSNCGNIIIPIVAYALGEDYLIYITAYIGVYNILLWTHGISLFKRQLKKEGKKGDFADTVTENVGEASVSKKISGFLKNLSLASMRSHMDRGRRDNIDVVLEAIPKDYFPKTLSEEEKGIGIQTAFSLASLSLLQAFSIEGRKEGSPEEDTKEREVFLQKILYVFQKQIQLLEKALGGIE